MCYYSADSFPIGLFTLSLPQHVYFYHAVCYSTVPLLLAPLVPLLSLCVSSSLPLLQYPYSLPDCLAYSGPCWAGRQKLIYILLCEVFPMQLALCLASHPGLSGRGMML